MTKYKYKIETCVQCERRTSSHLPDGTCLCKQCQMKNIEDKVDDIDKYKQMYDDMKDSEEYKLVKKLQKKNLRPNEIMSIVNASERGNPISEKIYRLSEDNSKFLIMGDTHIGNKNYDPGLMNHAVEMAKKEKVDFILHVGDIVDGWYQNRPQSLFEQNAIGFDEQLEMAIKEFKKFKKIKKPIYFITGNHEYNTFMRGAGVELGNVFQDRLKEKGINANYLGNAEGSVKLKGGSEIRLLHPDGGSSYAISYKTQKIVESLEGGKKPNILLIGHFHKAEYLFYRNVHCLQTGTLCGQTKFMKGRGLAAHKGFWIVDVNSNKGGQVNSIKPQFYPAYD